jgi:hypothetical protein
LNRIALPYRISNDSSWNKRPDIEFNIPYDDHRNKELDKFLNFLEVYPNTRINIEFLSEVNMEHLGVINKISDNVYVRVKVKDLPFVKQLSEKEFKFFFDNELKAYNYATLNSFIAAGVTDVYIADDLCYNLQEVKDYCEERNVNIRLVLNKIPMTTMDKGSNPTSIMYRPNDTDYLKQYYDTFEFYCGNPYDWRMHEALYTTYFIKREWIGELSELNHDIRLPLNNVTLDDDYSFYRMNCELKCTHGRPCRKCENLYEMADKMYSLQIRRKKNKVRSDSTIKMGRKQFDKANRELAKINKKAPLAGDLKVAFETIGIPVYWSTGKDCYQLDACVIADEEGDNSE